jgi:hypothetical protein
LPKAFSGGVLRLHSLAAIGEQGAFVQAENSWIRGSRLIAGSAELIAPERNMLSFHIENLATALVSLLPEGVGEGGL